MNNNTTKNRWGIPALALMVMATPLFVACDNYNNATGSDLMTEYNVAEFTSYTLPLSFETISADLQKPNTTSTISYNNIYVNSNYGYVGTIPNTMYGGTSCEYLTQVYCPNGFKFSEQPIANRIDSAFVVLSYSGYTGNGKDALEVTAYRLKSTLPFNKYSISDVSPYVDTTPENVLGRRSFTAEKGNMTTTSGQHIMIPIDKALGQKFYDLSKAQSAVFANQDNFNKFFPGMYIKATAGEGSILRVARTSLAFYYTVEETVVRKSTGAKDSVINVAHAQYLSHTIEQPQLARFANEGIDKLMAPNSEYTYVKSPAGVFTEITIPTVKIAQLLNQPKEGYVRELNSVPVVINASGQTDNAYSLPTPSDLILMPTDSVANFFAKELNEKDAPYSTYVSSKTSAESKSYSFGNIVQLVKQHIKQHPDRDLKVAIIPILRAQESNDKNSYNYSSSATPIAISNLILPSAMKISTGEENNKLNIIITERKVGAPF